MKKAVWFLVPLLAVLFVVPLGAAVVLAAVITPAAAEQTRLEACGTTVPVSGDWRPPFQQAYVKTSDYGNRFHPIDLEWRLHAGADLVSQPGPGPVVAVAAARASSGGASRQGSARSTANCDSGRGRRRDSGG